VGGVLWVLSGGWAVRWGGIRIIRGSGPFRIDGAGGWTDVDLFAKGAGGAVVSATIDKYVAVELEIPDSAEHHEGLWEPGLAVSYRSDLPSGSGLGTSATLNVVWLSLIRCGVSGVEDRKMIAELAYDLERVLGILGGKQDQYASAIGGINSFRFEETVSFEPLNLAPEVSSALQSRLVLCYTGKPRLSSNIHEHVWGAYKRGVPESVKALYTLRECAYRMKDALREGDLESFAELMNLNWSQQKALHSSVTNPQIESLFRTAFDAGATAGKACGAGGGGCILFYCPDLASRSRVSDALARAGTRIIDFKFDYEGLRVWRAD